MTLLPGQTVDIRLLKIAADLIVQLLFIRVRQESLHDCLSVGELNEVPHVGTQGPFTHCRQAFFQRLGIRHPLGVPLLESVQRPEVLLIDHADQPVKLEERILQRGRRQQNFEPLFHRPLDRVGILVSWLIDVSKAVSLIDYHHVPLDVPDEIRALRREGVGGDDHRRLNEGIEVSFGPLFQNRTPFDDHRREVELLR